MVICLPNNFSIAVFGLIQKGLNEDAITQYERCGTNAAYAKIGV
jgi:hypothetical protein